MYEQYTYNYPHKHAYRAFDQPYDLQEVWKSQNLQNVFAYAHLPFCEMRCGFCNLFTVANPKSGISEYLQAMRREADVYRDLVKPVRFSAFAIGGGTPTFLDPKNFNYLLETLNENLGVPMSTIYGSIESSPKSITQEKIRLIEEYGITRLSMGIQSWIETETKALGRPQKTEEVEMALDYIVNSKIPEFNLDIIYGIKGQTKNSLLYSLEKTISYRPTEIFLYPLYQRPLTGLDKMMDSESGDQRLVLYRVAREYLLSNGYRQESMRCFRHEKCSVNKSSTDGGLQPVIGIGAGARSYTSEVHYSTSYAVTRNAVSEIIHEYSQKQLVDFREIAYGITLSETDQRRHFLIKSLIDGGVLYVEDYQRRFNRSVFDDDIINQLDLLGFLTLGEKVIRLNAQGMENEDRIGPAMFSAGIKQLMSEYSLT